MLAGIAGRVRPKGSPQAPRSYRRIWRSPGTPWRRMSGCTGVALVPGGGQARTVDMQPFLPVSLLFCVAAQPAMPTTSNSIKIRFIPILNSRPAKEQSRFNSLSSEAFMLSVSKFSMNDIRLRPKHGLNERQIPELALKMISQRVLRFGFVAHRQRSAYGRQDNARDGQPLGQR